MIYLLFFIIVIFIYCLSSNLYNYFRVKRLKNYYIKWLIGEKENFTTYKNEIISLFKKAKIKDSFFPTLNYAGYGLLASFNASVFSNLLSKENSVVQHVSLMFDEAIGYFRKNIFNCFNPLYWLERIIFLPKQFLLYIGIKNDKSSFRALNISLTLLWWIIVIIGFVFGDKVDSFITTTVQNFFNIFA